MVYPLPCRFIYYGLLPALRLCLRTWLPMWLFLKQNLRMPDPRWEEFLAAQSPSQDWEPDRSHPDLIWHLCGHGGITTSQQAWFAEWPLHGHPFSGPPHQSQATGKMPNSCLGCSHTDSYVRNCGKQRYLPDSGKFPPPLGNPDLIKMVLGTNLKCELSEHRKWFCPMDMVLGNFFFLTFHTLLRTRYYPVCEIRKLKLRLRNYLKVTQL